MPIQEVEYIWMNGEFIKWNKAKVPILTHALHYGTAVFEGIRAYPSENNLLIFRLKDHLERLIESAKVLPLEHSQSVTKLENVIIELLKINKL